MTPTAYHCGSKIRQGTVLIIVAGLATVLMALVGTFLSRVRADTSANDILVGNAQNRITLVSALSYIQEASRMGWCTDPSYQLWGSSSEFVAGDTYGWTDIRDGSLGPRGPMPPAGSTAPSWWQSNWPAFPAPPPYWWESDWGTFGSLPATDSAWRGSKIRWPGPGSILRADLYAMQRPPLAIQPTIAPNPIAGLQGPSDTLNMSGTRGQDRPSSTVETAGWSDFDGAVSNSHGTWVGMLDPQPVADNVTDFLNGDTTPTIESQGRVWFRIYRELPQDHDNIDNPNWTDPYYDKVPLQGHSSFIITVGYGGTRGYRWFDSTHASELGQSDLFADIAEPETGAVSGYFGTGDDGRDVFKELRSREVIAWYRVQWSGNSDGGTTEIYDDGRFTNIMIDQQEDLDVDGGYGDYGNQGHFKTWFGSFRFVQRLTREPPRW